MRREEKRGEAKRGEERRRKEKREEAVTSSREMCDDNKERF